MEVSFFICIHWKKSFFQLCFQYTYVLYDLFCICIILLEFYAFLRYLDGRINLKILTPSPAWWNLMTLFSTQQWRLQMDAMLPRFSQDSFTTALWQWNELPSIFQKTNWKWLISCVPKIYKETIFCNHCRVGRHLLWLFCLPSLWIQSDRTDWKQGFSWETKPDRATKTGDLPGVIAGTSATPLTWHFAQRSEAWKYFVW